MLKKVIFLIAMSGCGSAVADRSTVFYTFNDTLNSPNGRIYSTVGVPVPINISGTSNASLTYRECNGFTWSHGLFWSEFFAWMVIPKTTVYNGHIIYLDIQSRGRWSLDSEDNDNYYLTQGYAWDEVHIAGNTCMPSGDSPSLSWTFGGVTMNAYLPADMPLGMHTIPIKFLRGIQRNNFTYIGGRYKIPSSRMKTFTFRSVSNLNFEIVGGCRPSVQSLDIEHGSLSIDNANGHMAHKSLSVYCDIPASINIYLLPNTPGNYSSTGTNVGLGNGWDSIVSLDGVERDKENIRWSSAGSKTITVGSRLYGEAGKIKPGNLSGSMTMVFSIR
ncbi:fimbrial protein [Escherichia coli]